MRMLSTNFAPLRHRGFRRLMIGQLASNVGDLFYAVALPWYVLANHGGALLLGTVLAAYGIPRTALLAVSGHLADRWRPWNVMLAADVLRVLGTAALAIAAYSGPASTLLLVPIAIVLGAGEGLFLPSSFSIVPSLLPDEDLQAGNALTSGGTQLATLLGPVLGGVAVALVGPASAFAVDSASFAVSVLALVGVRRAERTSTPPASPTPSEVTKNGDQLPTAPSTLRAMFRTERVLQVILLVSITANLGSGGMSEVALPALVHGPLHDGASGYGMLIAAFGGGALAGTIIAGHTTQIRRPAVVASWAFLVQSVALAAIPYVGGTIAAGVALAIFGLLNSFANVITITVFQRWAPPTMLGRLMGVLMLAGFGLFPLSVLAAGFVVTHAGASLFFPLAGAALGLAVLGGLTQRSWREFGVRDGGRARLAEAPL